MGNIQIKQSNRKGYSIFGTKNRETSRSPFRQVVAPKSPYYNNFSPIRYAEKSQQKHSQYKQPQKSQLIVRSPLSKENQLPFPSKNKEKRIINQKKQEYLNEINQQNKQKCQEIVKKVRNFNDFLLQLKKRIKDDCIVKGEGRGQRNQVNLSVKLQNERLQLQKYKKLVQRELSKTHSIESINIHNNQNGQKILTIQYQNLNQHEEKNENYDLQQNIKQIEHPTDITSQFLKTHHNQISNHSQIQQSTSQKQNLQIQKPLKNIFNFISQQQDKQKMNKTQLYKYTNREQTFDEQIWPIQQFRQRYATKGQKLKEAKHLYQLMKKRLEYLNIRLQQQIELNKDWKQSQNLVQYKQKGVRVTEMYNMIYEANRQSIQIQKRIKYLLI